MMSYMTILNSIFPLYLFLKQVLKNIRIFDNIYIPESSQKRKIRYKRKLEKILRIQKITSLVIIHFIKRNLNYKLN